MNPAEAAALLGIAAAFDNRKPDADAAKAWAIALDGLRFEDCRDAVVAHFRASSDWLMPSVVIHHVKQARDRRIKAHGGIAPPSHLDPDDTAAYSRWFSVTYNAIANGEEVPTVTSTGVPMPKELAAGMSTFGVMPPTDARARKEAMSTEPETEGA